VQLFAYCIICCKGFLAAACRITIAFAWACIQEAHYCNTQNFDAKVEATVSFDMHSGAAPEILILLSVDPMVGPLKSLASNISLICYGG
jgi:hypothetical protein